MYFHIIKIDATICVCGLTAMPAKEDLGRFFDRIKPRKSCVMKSHADNECKECGSRLIIGPEGFPTCSSPSCSIMSTKVLDVSPEWRNGGAQGPGGGNPTRCGMPINPLLQESSFGLRVLTNSTSSYQMRKIGRYTTWIGMPYKEKAHYDEFQRISLLAEQAGIPKLIILDAQRYHKMISERKTFRGLNRDGIIAASVYLSARVNGFPRTPKEISRVFILDQGATTRGCKNAMSIFNEIESGLESSQKTHLCLSTPASFIPRYCSRLGLTDELQKLCSFIAFRIEDLSLVPENTPHAKAAGLIYFVIHSCNLAITKGMVAETTEISEVTINKCFRKLGEYKAQLLPPQIAQKYILS